jgi:hypothetical protein
MLWRGAHPAVRVQDTATAAKPGLKAIRIQDELSKLNEKQKPDLGQLIMSKLEVFCSLRPSTYIEQFRKQPHRTVSRLNY